jgi:hypothetical protein
MFSSLVLAAAVAPAAPVPKDAARGPSGPPPKLAYLRALTTGTLRVYTYTPRVVKRPVTVTEVVGGKQQPRTVEREVTVNSLTGKLLADYNPTITTAGGTKKTAEDVAALAKDGLPVLVSADGKPVDPAWLRLLAPDAVVIASPDLTGVRTTTTVSAAGGRYPSTHPPVLAQVTTDAAGKPVVRVPPQTPGQAGPAAPTPLDGLKFEAFDADGTAVPRDDALARAVRGGAVLISSDGRVPDRRYVAAFGRDILVIVAPDLRTAVPAAAAVRPLPINLNLRVLPAPLPPPRGGR